ncbi:MAG: T9SS type A sorting domain-containing protein [Bacteroidia bacterium]|nr:T9SS type A sorting domain-containing protein [Bacteroidia bacterium]
MKITLQKKKLRTTLKFVLLIFLAASFDLAKAQTMSFTINTPSQCYNPVGNSVTGVLTNTQAGATSYSWSISSPSTCAATFTLAAPNGSAVSINLPCTGAYTLNFFAMNGSTVISTASTTMAVLAAPSASILNLTSGGTVVCSGHQVNPIGMGANTYTWNWPTGTSTGTGVLVTLWSSTCLSLTAQNNLGCNSYTSICFNVIPSPTPIVTSNATVCAGSAVVCSVSAVGAVSYTWNSIFVNPNTNNYTHVGSTATCITFPSGIVGGTILATGSNGCTNLLSTGVFSLPGNSLCAVVWPGDANRDGTVDNTDVFEIGFGFNNTGPSRSAATNSWVGQNASAWSGVISTTSINGIGWNQCHADCNGDGTINNSDLLAISANYSLTHSFKSPPSSANPDIRIVPSSTIAYAGTWYKADVVIGDASNNLSNLYGLAFDLNYDQSAIQTDSVKVIYSSSFLNASNQNVHFQKPFFNNGKLYCASIRTNGNSVNGNGKIAELWFKVKSGLANNTVVNLSATDAKSVNNTGLIGSLTSGNTATVLISNNLQALESYVQKTEIRFYPNPVKDMLTFFSDMNGSVTYSVYDVTGRLIFTGEFAGTKTISVAELEKGTYLIKFNQALNQVSNQVLIKE